MSILDAIDWSHPAASRLLDRGIQHALRRLFPEPPQPDPYREHLHRMLTLLEAGSATSASAGAGSAYLAQEGAVREDRDTGCLGCASAHLALASHMLRRAAQGGPDAARARRIARRELEALLAVDWTSERVAASPPRERELLSSYVPRVAELARELAEGGHTGELVGAWAQVDEAARFAREDGVRHREVETRLARAEELLVAAERAGDLAPAASADPEAARQVLRRVRRLRQRLRPGALDGPSEVEAVAEELADVVAVAEELYPPRDGERTGAEQAERAEALRADYRRDLAGLHPVYHTLAGAQAPGRHTGSARVGAQAAMWFEAPTAREVRAVTAPEDVAALAGRIRAALEERGVRVVTRNLESTPEGSLEGLYDVDAGNIVLSTAVRLEAGTPYSLEVLAHEAAHALLHSPECQPAPSRYHEREELEADLATAAALAELGVPIELWDGTVLPPGSREVDWGRMQQLDPTLYRNTRWAAGWIVAAAEGVDPGELAAQTCPAAG